MTAEAQHSSSIPLFLLSSRTKCLASSRSHYSRESSESIQEQPSEDSEDSFVSWEDFLPCDENVEPIATDLVFDLIKLGFLFVSFSLVQTGIIM